MHGIGVVVVWGGEIMEAGVSCLERIVVETGECSIIMEYHQSCRCEKNKK